MSSAGSELTALLAACRAAPADDTPRLVLADWLDDHGDGDRAAFVRVQVELSHAIADAARTRALKQSERALLFANAEPWLGELFRIRATSGPRTTYQSQDEELAAIAAGVDKDIRFHRGLLTLTAVPVVRKIRRGPDRNKWEETQDALRSPVAPWIEGVVACYHGLAEFEQCVHARHAAGRLDATVTFDSRLQGYNAGRPVIETEADTPAAWRRFADCSNFAALRSLTVEKADGTGLLRELDDASAGRLVGLHLDCRPNVAEAAALAAEAPFHALAELSLGPLTATALRTLCRGPHFRNLQSLDLSGDPVGDAGLIALCESPLANTLRALELPNTGIGDAGIAALARSPLFGRLHGPSLNLTMNRIGDAGLAALAAAPGLLRFRKLVLRENRVGDAGVAALADSPYAANLAALDFWRNDVGDAGAMALAASPHLNAVADLSVKENRVTEAGRLALAERFGEAAKG